MSKYMAPTKSSPNTAATVRNIRGNADIYTYAAIKYFKNQRNYMIVNLKRFIVRSTIALYPGCSRRARWTIIDGITNDSKNEKEIEFVDESTSHRRKNGAPGTRAPIQEHRAVLGLVNPAEQVAYMKTDENRFYPLILRYIVFLNRELEREAEMEAGEGGKMKIQRNGRLP
jgi:hypothetical protein